MGKAASSAKAKPKSMKSSVKTSKKTLTKGKISPKQEALPKGQPKAGAKNSLPKGKGGKAMNKEQRAKARARVKKTNLSKNRLAKLGKMSLKEKIDAAAAAAETPEEAAETLKKTMTDQEKQSAWGKHQTFLRNNQEEADKNAELSKKEKGQSVAMWLLKTHKPKFMQLQSTVENNNTLTKGEVWESEKEMLNRFSQDEFDAHIASGRIKWRYDPWSEGVGNYYDQGNIKKEWKVSKYNRATMGLEWEAGEEDLEIFEEIQKKGAQSQLEEFERHLLGKGQGSLPKGKGTSLTKGKTRGGRGKGEQLAIEDGDPDETPPDETWDECLSKVRKCRDLCQTVNNNMDESLSKASACGRLSKQQKKEAEQLLKDGQANVDKLKATLVKRKAGMTVEQAKELMLACTTKAKEIKEERKELEQLASTAMSNATPRT